MAVKDIAALGWIGIALPEPGGGAGESLVEEALVDRELGRALISPAALFLQMAAHTACAAGQMDLAASFATAENPAGALMWADTPQAGRADAYLVQSDGASHFWGATGNEFLVVRLVAEAESSACNSVDPGLRVHRIASRQLEPRCTYLDADGALSRRTYVLSAAMLCGMAEASRDLAVDYAKERKQFGRPIGSFQAVKHRCADMHLRARSASAQMMLAAMSEAARLPDREAQVRAALIVATEAAILNAEAGIQIHGALGFSEECGAHRYLKRAHFLRILCGEGLTSRKKLADMLAAGMHGTEKNA